MHSRGQSHAQQHVREHRIHAAVRQRERVARIVDQGADPVGDPGVLRTVGQLLEGGRGEVGGGDGQAAPGEVQRVAPVPGAQFQHAVRASAGEQVGRVRGGRRRLLPVHPGVLPVGGLPVLALPPGQIAVHLLPHDSSISPAALNRPCCIHPRYPNHRAGVDLRDVPSRACGGPAYRALVDPGSG
jgi:hypothetical protein